MPGKSNLLKALIMKGVGSSSSTSWFTVQHVCQRMGKKKAGRRAYVAHHASLVSLQQTTQHCPLAAPSSLQSILYQMGLGLTQEKGLPHNLAEVGYIKMRPLL